LRPGPAQNPLTPEADVTNQDFFSYGPAPEPARKSLRDRDGDGIEDPQRAILAELSDEDWERFIGFAARRRYPAGASIVKRGDTPVPLGFVASGAVRVQGVPGVPGASGAPGADTFSERRDEGEVFGILGFLDGRPSQVDITAHGATEVLLLGREALVQLAAWQPRIAVALLRDLGALVAARLRRLHPAD
jgi:signal-transduction protein with cAMP-binding, CBS, and nucleotidyltransferase domain